MYQNLKRTCRATVQVIWKLFASRRSRCRGRGGLRKLLILITCYVEILLSSAVNVHVKFLFGVERCRYTFSLLYDILTPRNKPT